MNRLLCKIFGHRPWLTLFTPDDRSTTYAAVVCPRCGENRWRVWS